MPNELAPISWVALQKRNAELEQRVIELTAELQQSETNFRQVIESLPQLVWAADAHGINIYNSPQWTSYTGIPAESQMGTKWMEAIHPDDREGLAQAWQLAVKTGTAYRNEFRIRRHDGVYRWFATRALPLHDESGQVVKWYGTNTDIQEQREMREALRSSEERLRLATEAAQIGTWERDLKTNHLTWSAYQEQLMGYEPGTFPNTYEAFFALVHPEDHQRLAEAQQEARQSGVYKAELLFKLADGRERWGLLRGQTIYDEAGQPERVVGIDMDITERKRDEAALSKSYEQLRLMIEQAPVGIAMLDRNLCYLAASFRWKEDLDRVDQEFIGHSHYEIFPDIPEWWKEVHQQALAGEIIKNDEDEWRQADGSTVWLRWAVHPWRDAYDEIGGIIMSAENITPRKQAEIQLRESERRLQAIVENLTEGLIIADFEGQLGQWNRAALEMHGFRNLSEATLRVSEMEKIFELTTLEGRIVSSAERPMARLLRGEKLRGYEVRIRRRGADWERIFKYSGNTIVEPNGKTIAILSITDITTRKQAEENLRQSENHFRALFEAGGVGSVECEAQTGRFLRVNQKMCEIVGYSVEELKERTFAEITHPEDRDHMLGQYQRFITGEEPGYEVEKRYVRKDGSIVWVGVTSSLLLDQEGRPWHTVAVIQDITDRKQAEEEVRESEVRFRTLFEQDAVGKIIIDYDGLKVVACNQPAAKMLGYTCEELLELAIPDFEANQSLAETLRNREFILNDGNTQFQTLYRTKAGELRDVLVGCTNIRIKGKDFGYISVLDMTSQKRAEEELQRERLRLEKIAFSSPSVIYSFRVSPEGHYSYPYVSAAFSDLYGVGQDEVRQDARITDARVHPDDIQGLRQSILDSARNLSRWHYAWRVNHPSKGKVWIEGYSAPVREADGSIIWHGILNDVTEQKRAEQELRNSEDRLKLALAAARMGVWEWDLHTNAVFWSPECYEMLGSKNFDGTMAGFGKLIHPEERDRIMQLVQQSIVDKITYSAEFRVIRPDGKALWLMNLGRAHYNQQGSPTRMIGIAQDITERKLAEAELEQSLEQVRSLALHLQDVREEERKRMARELHDELGQALAGLKFDVAWLEHHLLPAASTTEQVIKKKTQTMSKLIDSTIQIGRKIATELRPRVLDDLGLIAALNWQARDFQMRTGITCEFIALTEDLTLDVGRATAAFRICQETLTNVLRHAQADTVTILLQVENNCLRLEIKDNGRGITKREINGAVSLGLLGMKERVLPYRGKIDIKGRAGKGTTITVLLPLETDQEVKK